MIDRNRKRMKHIGPESLQEILTLSAGGGGINTMHIYKAEHSTGLRTGRQFQRQRSHLAGHMQTFSPEEEISLRLVSRDVYKSVHQRYNLGQDVRAEK